MSKVSDFRMLGLQARPGARIRSERKHGREFFIVPVVALLGDAVVRPMHSKGPEFVPAGELSRDPSSWNGRPIMQNHPNGGRSPSFAPGVMEKHAMGFMANTRFEDGKLKTDAWLDVKRASEIGPEGEDILRRCLAGEMVEVSVGAFVSADATPGEHQGKKYAYRWSGLTPDHLAFLPAGMPGACSVEMGCGAPRALGGPGSGNFGHSGRPGERGGSGDGGGEGGSGKTGGRDYTQTHDSMKPENNDSSPGAVAAREAEASEELENIIKATGQKAEAHAAISHARERLKGSTDPVETIAAMLDENAADPNGAYSQTLRLIGRQILIAKATPAEPRDVRYQKTVGKLKTDNPGVRFSGAPNSGHFAHKGRAMSELSVTAACGCGGKSESDGHTAPASTEEEGASEMASNTVKELVGRLLASKPSVFTEECREHLEAFGEERLQALAEALETPQPKALGEILPQFKDHVKKAEGKDGAEEEDEEEDEDKKEQKAMAGLKPETREMIARFQAEETRQRTELVSTLAGAQKVFSADALNAKPTTELHALAQLLKLDAPPAPSFLGRGAATVTAAAAAAREAKPLPVPRPYSQAFGKSLATGEPLAPGN